MTRRLRANRNVFTASTLFLVGAAMALGLGTAAANPGTLTGVVTDATDQTPVENALVMARGNHGPRWALTDASGAYELENLREGEQNVRCWAQGFMPAQASVTIVAGETAALDFALTTFAFGQVQGLVTDAGTGEPIPGALVVLHPAAKYLSTDGEITRMHTITGPDGDYFFEHVFAGDYTVTARAFGYVESEPIAISVTQDQVITADLTLEPVSFGSADGTVTDAATGEPIEGAHVLVMPLTNNGKSERGGMGHGHWRTTTDADGHYLFEELVVGAYDVVVLARDYERANASILIVEGQTTTLDFALEGFTFGSVEGFVTDSVTTEPIEDAMAMFFRVGPLTVAGEPPPEKGGFFFARTDENGFFALDDIPAGTYQVRILARGYRYQALSVEVPGDDTTTLEIQLEPRN